MVGAGVGLNSASIVTHILLVTTLPRLLRRTFLHLVFEHLFFRVNPLKHKFLLFGLMQALTQTFLNPLLTLLLRVRPHFFLHFFFLNWALLSTVP